MTWFHVEFSSEEIFWHFSILLLRYVERRVFQTHDKLHNFASNKLAAYVNGSISFLYWNWLWVVGRKTFWVSGFAISSWNEKTFAPHTCERYEKYEKLKSAFFILLNSKSMHLNYKLQSRQRWKFTKFSFQIEVNGKS